MAMCACGPQLRKLDLLQNKPRRRGEMASKSYHSSKPHPQSLTLYLGLAPERAHFSHRPTPSQAFPLFQVHHNLHQRKEVGKHTVHGSC